MGMERRAKLITKIPSGIGDLDLLSKKSNAVVINIDQNGNISGIPTGIMKDNESQVFMTNDMVGKE